MVPWVTGKLNQGNFALVVGKNRENQENFALVIGKNRENGGFSIKNFARVIGLLFGSAGAHTYLKSGQVTPPPLSKIVSWTAIFSQFLINGLADTVKYLVDVNSQGRDVISFYIRLTTMFSDTVKSDCNFLVQ